MHGGPGVAAAPGQVPLPSDAPQEGHCVSVPPAQVQPLPPVPRVGPRDPALPRAAGGVRQGFPGHHGHPGLSEDPGQPRHLALTSRSQAALMGTGMATSR